MSEESDDNLALALMMVQGYCELGTEALEQIKIKLAAEKALLEKSMNDLKYHQQENPSPDSEK